MSHPYDFSLFSLPTGPRQHDVQVFRIRGDAVTVLITFNISSVIPTFSALAPNAPVTDFDWRVKSSEQTYTDEAGTIATTDAQRFRHWGDLSSNDLDATQGDLITDIELPIWHENVDGYNAVQFISRPIGSIFAGSHLRMTGLGEIATFYFLVRVDDTAPVVGLTGCLFGNLAYRINLYGTDAGVQRDTDYIVPVPPTTGTWRLISGTFNSSTGDLIVYENGIKIGQDNVGTVEALPSSPNDITAIGARVNPFFSSVNLTNTLNCHMLEGVIWYDVETAEDRLENLKYFANEYQNLPNFTISLDGATTTESAPQSTFSLGGANAYGFFTDTAASNWAFVGDRVRYWQGKGGRALEQNATTSTHPTLRLEDGVLCLEFDGGDRLKFNYWLEDSQSYSYIVVYKQESINPSADIRYLIGYQNSATTSQYRSIRTNAAVDNRTTHASAAFNGRVSSGSFYNSWIVVGVTFDAISDTTKIYINGYLEDTIVEAPDGAIDLAIEGLIGARYLSAVVSNHFIGFIRQINMYKDILLTDQQMLAKALEFGDGLIITPIDLNGVLPDVFLTGTEDMYSDSGGTTIQNTDTGDVKLWISQSKTPYIFQRNSSAVPQLSTQDGIRSLLFPAGNTNKYLLHHYWKDYHTGVMLCHQESITDSLRTILSYWASTTGGVWNCMIRPVRSTAERGSIHLDLNLGVEFPRLEDEWYIFAWRYNTTDGLEVQLNGISVGTDTSGTRTTPPFNASYFPLMGARYVGTLINEYADSLRVAALALVSERLDDNNFNKLQVGVRSRYTSDITLPVLGVPSSVISTGLEVDWDANFAYSDAGSTLTIPGNVVQQVSDQSGNGWHATQTLANGGAKPNLETIDSLPALDFTTGEWLEHTFLGDFQILYIVYDLTSANTGVNRSLFGQGRSAAGSNIARYINSTDASDLIAANVRTATDVTATRTLSTWTLIVFRYDTTSFKQELFVNTKFKATTTGSSKDTTAGTGGFGISGHKTAGTFVNQHVGRIRQCLIYTTKHKDSEILANSYALADKWNLSF